MRNSFQNGYTISRAEMNLLLEFIYSTELKEGEV